MSAAVARKVIGSFRERSDVRSCEPLSAREKNLLNLLADGLGYKEISAQLGISPHTVHAHVRNIYAKLHATDRTEALSIAAKLGYLVQRPKS